MQNAGNVVLAFSFSPVQEFQVGEGDLNAARLELLNREANAVTPAAIGDSKDTHQILPNVPLDQLANAAVGLGTIDAALDSDGAARRVALAVTVHDAKHDARSFRSFDLRVADQVTIIHKGRLILTSSMDEIKDTHRRVTLRFGEPIERPPSLVGARSFEGSCLKQSTVQAIVRIVAGETLGATICPEIAVS